LAQHLWFQTPFAADPYSQPERPMPVSAYVQSAIFLILAAVALFASAGTLAIIGFWLYLAILAAIIVASLLALDPGLLQERMRPGESGRRQACSCSQLSCFCTGSSPGSIAGAFTGATMFLLGSRPSA
jgi:hypothetical protein